MCVGFCWYEEESAYAADDEADDHALDAAYFFDESTEGDSEDEGYEALDTEEDA